MNIKAYSHNNILLLFFTVILITIASCKGDKNTQSLDELLDEGANIDLNFSINGKTKNDRIGLDFSKNLYFDDPKNEDYVTYVTIGDSIYFEDKTIIPEEMSKARKWYIGTNQLPSNAREVAWYSDIPGTILVTLKYNDDLVVQKGVFLQEDMSVEDPNFTEEVVADEADEAFASMDEEPVATPEPVQKAQTNTAAKSANVSAKPKPTPKPKSKPAVVNKPAPPAIQTVDFSLGKDTYYVGESVLVRDQSSPASAIRLRSWDFGNGNISNTKGSVVSQPYYKEGTYTITLCLNKSSKCKKKTVKILPPKEVLVKATPKPAKPAAKVEAPKVSKVYFAMPSKGKVGETINFEDTSVPSSAVTSRKWYINGKDINLTRKKVSKIFDKAGNYEVRLCVNNSSKDCYSTVLKIDEVKKEVVKANTPASSAADEEFFCVSTKKGGIRTSQKCPSSEKKMIAKNTKVKLKPKTRVELRNATIYGSDIGVVDIKLTSSDGKVNKILKKIQILPGRSVVEFGDFAITLEPNVFYTLEVVMPSDGSLQVEDSGACNTNFSKTKEMDITYEGGNMVLMDIKFCF